MIQHATLDVTAFTDETTIASHKIGLLGSVFLKFANHDTLQCVGTAEQLSRFGQSIVLAADDLRRQIRDAILDEWRVAHPEQPQPLGFGGKCPACGSAASMLFVARVGLGGNEVEVCGTCASVDDDLAEQLVRSILPEAVAA